MSKDLKATVQGLEPTSSDIVHLARLALCGSSQDLRLYVKRLAKKVRDGDPALADELIRLLCEAPARTSPLRQAQGR